MEAPDPSVLQEVVNWKQTLKQEWAKLHFGGVKVETRGEQHVFEVEVFLNDLDPNALSVELYADGIEGGAPVRQEMNPDSLGQLAGASDGHVHSAAVSAAPRATDYTARVIPRCDTVAVLLGDARILWQR